MSMIYFVITCILGVLSWFCSQINWMYKTELFYVVLFITGIFLALTFVQQEDNVNKKYSVFSPGNILYFLIVAIVLIILKDYSVKDYKIIQYSFVKVAAIINAGTAMLLILFYKIRDFFYNC